MNIDRIRARDSFLDQSGIVGNPDESGKIGASVRAKTNEEQHREPEKNIPRPPIEGLHKLSPIDQYRYLDGQNSFQNGASLRMIPGNPQKSLAMANQVINDAVLPPVFSNPNRNRLGEALQIKRRAESILDRAA